MNRSLVLAVAVLSLTGCAHSSPKLRLSYVGRAVVVLGATPAECTDLGVVVGHGGGSARVYRDGAVVVEEALIDLRNKAATRGATHVVPKGPSVTTSEDFWGDDRPVALHNF